MGELRLVLPTLEYGDQVMAFKQECLDIGSSMDGCGPLRRSNTVAEWLEARPGAVVVTDIKENNLAGAALICGGVVTEILRPAEAPSEKAAEESQILTEETK